ncbi:hypothetical protein NE237_020218 [Protea cynaroides]|uniref:NAC domain-containing protein n=1 Tax=Protea cynaroides TaxID=273540 RepID=A0A9Q0H8N2_9MAGN|nr:hypothetical protein NE237_020218 [Protea cynaroides]
MASSSSKKENSTTMELPVGFRFKPTEEELVRDYLSPKTLGQPLPAAEIEDIDVTVLYSQPPNKLEMISRGTTNECFFFIRYRCSQNGLASIRPVGNGQGFWKYDGEGIINNSDGHKLAIRISWTYYSGTPKNGKITRWVMFEYRLQMENDQCNNQEEEEWVLGRIKYSWSYGSPFKCAIGRFELREAIPCLFLFTKSRLEVWADVELQEAIHRRS